ncbi:MAG: hypothetical protein KatS3mg102_2988 [Planctomycetota bacterium]|nr:MAG: hypothetical protein KatS3mg102_2988 [Planctomycetota bacterium]
MAACARHTLEFLLPVVLAAATGCAAAPGHAEAKAASLRALAPSVRAAVELAAAHARERVVKIRPGLLSVGSGSVLSADGWILTAAHVVGSRSEVDVELPGGPELPARVVLTNPDNDFALLKVQASGLRYFQLGPRPERGQRVVAVGAWEQGGRPPVSTGAVVYPRIRLPGEHGAYYYDAIFHTAPIVPGDSGGALVDLRGRLVGVHGAYATAGASIATAVEEVRRQLFGRAGGPADLDELGRRLPAGTATWVMSGLRPHDFQQSAAWTLASVRETLVALYGEAGAERIDRVLVAAHARHAARRLAEQRSDDELVRAMLQEVFRELDRRARAPAPAGTAGGASAPEEDQ